jgi:DNA-binding PadR family transcriptional regulator
MGRPKIYTDEELKERTKIRQKVYYKTYYFSKKEDYAKRAKNYRATEKGKKALEKARKKERDNLSDNYIRQNLAVQLHHLGYSLDRKSVSKEVIEISRQAISANRELKTLKYEHK